MDLSIISLIVALVLAVIAWKVLKGIVKTIVVLGILVVAGVFVFGGMA
jgi:hypothetical protein